MDFEFKDRKLEKLYSERKGAEKYPAEVVDAFFRRMAVIRGATDERDFYALKSLHFEKLRTGGHSMRLNEGWRLALNFEKRLSGKIVIVIEINKHYGD